MIVRDIEKKERWTNSDMKLYFGINFENPERNKMDKSYSFNFVDDIDAFGAKESLAEWVKLMELFVFENQRQRDSFSSIFKKICEAQGKRFSEFKQFFEKNSTWKVQ